MSTHEEVTSSATASAQCQIKMFCWLVLSLPVYSVRSTPCKKQLSLSLLSLSSISLSFLPLSLVCLLHTQKRLPVSCVDSSCRKHPPFINKIFRSAVMAVKVVSFFFFFFHFLLQEKSSLFISLPLYIQKTLQVFFTL